MSLLIEIVEILVNNDSFFIFLMDKDKLKKTFFC
jgi:hypothetical protein